MYFSLVSGADQKGNSGFVLRMPRVGLGGYLGAVPRFRLYSVSLVRGGSVNLVLIEGVAYPS